ncbi:MAG: sugar nucleotide-binding protein [Candidatus Ancillula sp.]|nr:sugar nucleotide-binding protein [Candidatus Ancillula sp.]
MEYGKDLKFSSTTIEGLVTLDLPVHGDNRGWFKENWQRAKMTTAGGSNVRVPDFKIVQNNISFNAQRGVTRGIHAEPWDKFISVGSGAVFGAWVDLRAGSPTFGEVFTMVIDPSKAIFVPRGVGNSFQAIEDDTVYTYLVNDHWSQDAQSLYTFVNLADPTLKIDWPIPLDQAQLSEKDKSHPMLKDVEPMLPKKTLVIGANGQLGRAIKTEVEKNHTFPATFVYSDVVADESRSIIELDACDEDALRSLGLEGYSTIINAAAYTAVDSAETTEGRKLSWKLNANMPATLAKIANEFDLTLVHISSDYVFDGELCNHPAGVPCIADCQHLEDEELSPLGVYGQTKAAGDIAVQVARKHYIMRTSWVVGDGNNFVKTMYSLAKKDVKPNVISDQYGRLTFTSTLARGIAYVLENQPEYGVYNLSNDGNSSSWCSIARRTFELYGMTESEAKEAVSGISTQDYAAPIIEQGKPFSPRPTNSALNLSKIMAIGFVPHSWEVELQKYVEVLKDEV